ncbi:MAG: leucine-rich repeat domain-containing protein [Muribaculaceae bacterium]|nr:leucine-rich repeat domain-containing protein [Muribaculaceae bacterium]
MSIEEEISKIEKTKNNLRSLLVDFCDTNIDTLKFADYSNEFQKITDIKTFLFQGDLGKINYYAYTYQDGIFLNKCYLTEDFSNNLPTESLFVKVFVERGNSGGVRDMIEYKSFIQNYLDTNGDLVVFDDENESHTYTRNPSYDFSYGKYFDLKDSSLQEVRDYACYYHYSLRNVNLPNVKRIGKYAFRGCCNVESFIAPNLEIVEEDGLENLGINYMEKIDLPKLQIIEDFGLYNVRAVNINLPELTTINRSGMRNNGCVETLDFPKLSNIGIMAFESCYSLEKIILRTNSVCILANKNAFDSTPIKSTFYTGNYGNIYVPDELVEDYKVAENWSTYADRIKPISELEE